MHRATGGRGAPKAGAASLPNLGYLETPLGQTFHVAVTGDDQNPGTAGLPWRTLGKAVATLQAGQTAFVHAGTYGEHLDIVGRDGNARAPIRLMAAPGEARPVILAQATKALVRVTRSHWILDGLVLDAGGHQAFGIILEGARNVTVQRCEVRNGTGPAAVTVSAGGSDIHLRGNVVHNYRYALGGARADSHAFFVGPDARRVLLRDNEAYENSGDGFQCQGPREAGSGSSPPTDLTLEDNRFHHNLENAVDIKSCRRVTVRGVEGRSEFYGHRNVELAKGPCGGAAVVVHYDAAEILIEGNRFSDNGAGIAIGREDSLTQNVVIRRNLFTGMTQDGNGCGDGIIVGKSRQVAVFNNTFDGLPAAALHLASSPAAPVEDLQIWNNVVSNVGVAFDLYLANAHGFASDRNLFWNGRNPMQFRRDGAFVDFAGWAADADRDGSSVEGDPAFQSGPAGDHLLAHTSIGRDLAVNIDDPLYCEGGPDLGYAESCQ
jgi:hypothetical protein